MSTLVTLQPSVDKEELKVVTSESLIVLPLIIVILFSKGLWTPWFFSIWVFHVKILCIHVLCFLSVLRYSRYLHPHT